MRVYTNEDWDTEMYQRAQEHVELFYEEAGGLWGRVCIYIYIYVYTHVYVYINMYIYIYIHIYIYIYVCMYI